MEGRPTDRSDDIFVLLPHGRLDAKVAPDLEHELNALEERGLTQVVINLCHASYISSSCLRILLTHVRKLRQAGGDLKLCCLADKIAQVLHITGLDTIFDSLPSEKLAVQAFSAPVKGTPASPDQG